jgi:transcription initiation factor IIE alpha subunit
MRDVLEDLISQDYTKEEIIEKLGLTKNSLRTILYVNGIKLKSHGNRTPRPIKEKVFSLLKEHNQITTVELLKHLDGATNHTNLCRALRRWEKKGLITRQGVKPSKKGNNGATVYSYTWKINEDK